MHTQLRKNDFNFFKLMNNVGFRKNMENVIKRQRYQTCNNSKKKNYIVSESNYTKNIFKNFISRRSKKTQILINKLVYLGLSISEISKIVMNEFWYD